MLFILMLSFFVLGKDSSMGHDLSPLLGDADSRSLPVCAWSPSSPVGGGLRSAFELMRAPFCLAALFIVYSGPRLGYGK